MRSPTIFDRIGGAEGVHKLVKRFYDLEWLTRPIHEPRIDDGCGQCEQGLMDIEPPLKSDPQLSEPSKPCVGALDNPAVFSQPLTAFNASAGNPAQDAFGLQIGPATTVVVALVRMQFSGALARPARQASERRDCVNAGFEQHGVMPVGPADQHHQRNAPSVYDDMPFGAQFAPVGWVGACLLAPRGLGTVEPSMLARSQSIWSCSRSRTSIA